MAVRSLAVPLQPPGPLNFIKPDEWPRWRKRFEQFRIASGLSEETEERQVSTLLYCLGEEAEDVLASTGITADDRKKYDAVQTQLDGFFNVRKNVIFERARFNQRNQMVGESAERYITALYSLVENCRCLCPHLPLLEVYESCEKCTPYPKWTRLWPNSQVLPCSAN